MIDKQQILIDVVKVLAKELDGKMTESIYSDPNITKRKIVIEYDINPKG